MQLLGSIVLFFCYASRFSPSFLAAIPFLLVLCYPLSFPSSVSFCIHAFASCVKLSVSLAPGYVQSHAEELGANLRYSTLSEYFDAVLAEASSSRPSSSSSPANSSVLEFPVYKGDFFPYADNRDSYWTVGEDRVERSMKKCKEGEGLVNE